MGIPVSKRERFFIALSVTLALLLFIGGRSLPEVSAKEDKEALFGELEVFTQVLAIVQRDYVREVGSKELVEGAIKGMLSTLDPHSGYLDPDFYKDLKVQTRGEFGGLGIEITMKDGLLIVVAPMEGSPAEAAGIRAGDAIVKIEGKFTKDFSLVDAVKRLRGPKGEAINISIARKGLQGLLDVSIVRDNIEVKSVRHRYLGDGFGYVRISQFMEKTTADLKVALRNLAKKGEKLGLKGLVLDMRNNPGGLLTQAIQVSDLFLKEGLIVYTDGRIDNQRQKFHAHAAGTEPDYPIIVLVNGGSASASEIVAGALKDQGRGLILGTQTFGKGSVQTITPLQNNGAVTLTTALYYTSSGKSIQVTGVHPDIIMEQEAVPVATKEEQDSVKPLRLREGDLPGAISNPQKKKGGAGGAMKKLNKTPTIRPDISSIRPEDIDIEEWLKRDSQLRRAFDLLKTFNIFEGRKEERQALMKAEAKKMQAKDDAKTKKDN